jgi:hypothetical protein
VLCDLEGKTRKDAARHLSWPEGTVATRLVRARLLLARRLTRRGVSLSAGALAVALTEKAAAAVPVPLVNVTVKAAALLAAGPAAGVVTPAAALMNEVLKAMLVTKLKIAVLSVLAVVLLGTGGLVYRAAGQSDSAAQPGAGRPLSELEVLRREMEILKLQVELLQDKVRALEGQGGGTPKARTAQQAPPGSSASPKQVPRLPTTAPANSKPLPALPGTSAATANSKPVTTPGTVVLDGSQSLILNAGDPHLALSLARSYLAEVQSPSVEQEVEAAMKAFREAKDNETKHRSAEALEKALQKLRHQLKPQTQLRGS